MRVVPPPGKPHCPPAHLGVLPSCGRLPFPALTAFSPTRFIIAAARRVPVRRDTLRLKPTSLRNQAGEV